jgi:hypothetical protein
VWIFGWSENWNWATNFYCPKHQKTQKKVRWQWGRCQNDLKLKPPRAKETPQEKGGKSWMKKNLVHKISWSEHQQTEKSLKEQSTSTTHQNSSWGWGLYNLYLDIIWDVIWKPLEAKIQWMQCKHRERAVQNTQV